MINFKNKDKRLILASLLIAVLAISFWTGSRIPQLNEKASMGAETNMTTLGFDTVFEIQPDDGLIKAIAYTTVNWMDTNKKGMAFGVLFAAALMTIFSLIRRRSFKNGFANSALGLVIGAPLGVCVNCAAPIAAGMAAAGSRLETTLATMISSPTMNVIVITMLLSLFPFYIVIIKLGLSLIFIILVIPLICRFFLKQEVLNSTVDNEFCGIGANDTCPVPDTKDEENSQFWLKSTQWLFINYFKNFWFVFKTTVPLMVLAGFLGAIMITILPWSELSDIIPTDSKFMVIISMFFIAAVGLFLPVPIAFDVVVSAVLLAAGMPVKYVMVLLFTLGIYSVYSFFVVSRFVSKRAAIVVYFTLIPFGVVAGIAAHFFHKKELQSNKILLIEHLKSLKITKDFDYRTHVISSGEKQSVLVAELNEIKETFNTPVMFENNTVKLESKEFNKKISKNPTTESDFNFSSLDPKHLGIYENNKFSFMKLTIPVSHGYGRTVSTADVHNDGKMDLLFVTENGLSLYANLGGVKFKKQSIGNISFNDFYVTDASFVDINNDKWQDILFTTLNNGNYLIYNHNGIFSNDLVKLPKGDDNVMTTAVGFSDIDNDGDIDIVLGNWSIGWGKGAWMSSRRSKNEILINTGDGFIVSSMNELPGVPLSMVLSDINNDNNVDLIIGNDFDVPDYFYYGDGKGGFKQIFKDDNIIPHSTHDTMNVITADINNDLKTDIFIGSISRYSDNHDKFFTKQVDEVCLSLTKDDEIDKCKKSAKLHKIFFNIVQTNNVKKCLEVKSEEYKNQCIAFFFARKPNAHGGNEICDSLPDKWKSVKNICNLNLQESFKPTKNQINNGIPQQVNKNVLLVPDANNRYVDQAHDMGLDLTGWTWNAKFIDLDNDEWQDLFVATGWIEAEKRRESNYLYKNIKGKKFENITNEIGLSSFSATSSYAYIDLDNDGDLDIVTIPMDAPIQIYLNNTSTRNNAIEIVLSDEKANSYGIGSKIYIYYGENDKRHQYRELLGSGGFLSSEQPVAHFGLAQYKSISRIEVVWSTGKKSVINGTFSSGKKYRITRLN